MPTTLTVYGLKFLCQPKKDVFALLAEASLCPYDIERLYPFILGDFRILEFLRGVFCDPKRINYSGIVQMVDQWLALEPQDVRGILTRLWFYCYGEDIAKTQVVITGVTHVSRYYLSYFEEEDYRQKGFRYVVDRLCERGAEPRSIENLSALFEEMFRERYQGSPHRAKHHVTLKDEHSTRRCNLLPSATRLPVRQPPLKPLQCLACQAMTGFSVDPHSTVFPLRRKILMGDIELPAGLPPRLQAHIRSHARANELVRFLEDWCFHKEMTVMSFLEDWGFYKR